MSSLSTTDLELECSLRVCLRVEISRISLRVRNQNRSAFNMIADQFSHHLYRIQSVILIYNMMKYEVFKTVREINAQATIWCKWYAPFSAYSDWHYEEKSWRDCPNYFQKSSSEISMQSNCRRALSMVFDEQQWSCARNTMMLLLTSTISAPSSAAIASSHQNPMEERFASWCLRTRTSSLTNIPC